MSDPDSTLLKETSYEQNQRSIHDLAFSSWAPNPCIDSEQEARYVRYLIHEGFIDQRWPRVSNQIKEEAGWAYLL